ncbi:mCG1036781, partial [Mus musculus]
AFIFFSEQFRKCSPLKCSIDFESLFYLLETCTPRATTDRPAPCGCYTLVCCTHQVIFKEKLPRSLLHSPLSYLQSLLMMLWQGLQKML